MNGSINLKGLYDNRFSEQDLARKNAIWSVLCKNFFARYVNPNDTVIDIGAGYCEFINNISAAKKIAIDLNPDVQRFAGSGVRVINEDCTAISTLEDRCADVLFMSNFLEHLQAKQLVIRTLEESYRLLALGGIALILQPNIRLIGSAYWDYFDHFTALTDRSLCEALSMCGFRIEQCIPGFLPYTTKSALPQSPWLVSLYLRVPLVWRLLGKQTFIVARKPIEAQ